jgi:hypothetical protein
MNDRPTAPELLAAARVFLESELLPTLTDARLRFQTLITANVLAIVERELQTEEEQLLGEWQTLAPGEPVPARLAELRQAVRAANERLCEQVRRGDFDDPERFRALCAEMRRIVERKLEVANPRYMAGFRAGG